VGPLMGRRLAIRSTHWGLLGTTAAILVMLNLLGAHWFTRLDMTADKIYTPSESTRQLLASLDDNLLVRAYFTPDLPPPYNRNRQLLRDLLDEYRALSRGKVRYEFIDPATLGGEAGGGQQMAEQRMAMMGIPMVQVTDVSSDKLEVKNGFMGLAVLFGDQSEVIPVVQSTQGLEYTLTSKIRKLTGKGRGKVALAEGFGGPAASGEMAQAMQVLREQYDLTEVDLASGQDLPPDLAVLMVVDPTEPLSDWALSRIAGYVANGGGLAVFAAGVSADLQTQSASDLPDPFGGLLKDWGVNVGHNLVGDTRNARITVSQRRGIFTIQNMVDYPYIPVLSDLSRANPVVSGLESVLLPFVSTVKSDPVAGITYTDLIESSPTSWRSDAPYDIRALLPEGERPAATGRAGPHSVAVAAEGTFPDRFAGTTVTRPGAEGDAGEVQVPAPDAKPGRLLVVGSGDVLRDQYQMGGDNMPFVMNAIDWLARDEGLIALRSRGVTDRPLEAVSDAARDGIKAANIVGGAALLILFGLVRWKLRRVRRRRLEEAAL
jgi:gliding-associated putative ABC transporter substrate-binding component GldG